MSRNNQSKRPNPSRLGPGGFFRLPPPIFNKRKKPIQQTNFRPRQNAPNSSFAKLTATLAAAGRQGDAQ
jgi:hypothetical protein